MLQLTSENYRVGITNDPMYAVGSTDNVYSYDREYHLDDARAKYTVTSRHSVRVSLYNHLVSSCILLAGGGASSIHDHSAIIHNRSCIIAVGPFMASLAIPSLELNWATQTDDATCFGVHDSQDHDCLFSHGELFIARVSHDGTIVWQAGGADIFTNGFQLDGNVVRVVDFSDHHYVLDAETGRVIATNNALDRRRYNLSRLAE